MEAPGSKVAQSWSEHELLDGLCRSLTAHVAVLDRSGVVTYVNRAWEEFSARDRSEPIRPGINYLEACERAILAEPSAASRVEGIRAVLNRRMAGFSAEFVCHSPEGERWLLMRVEPMPEAHGGVVVSRTDITESRQAERSLRENEQRYRMLVNTIEGIVWEVALPSWSITFASRQAERILGYPVRQWTEEPNFWLNHIHPDDRGWAFDVCKMATEKGKDHDLEYRLIASDGRVVWVRDIVTVEVQEGRPVCLRGVMVDITASKTEEALIDGEKRILEMIASDVPLERVLTGVVRMFESQSDGMAGSIVLLDEDGLHVRHGAAPSLSPEFIGAIDGSAIGPAAGSCGTAMFLGRTIVVKDILDDPLWENYREPAIRAGLRACWSTPIVSHNGKVLGSFAMYYRDPRTPRDNETRLIEIAVHITRIAIERQQAQEELRRRNEHIRELAGKLIAIQEEERRRISRELHDDLIQRIAAVSIHLSSIKRRLHEPADSLRRHLEGIQQRVSELEENVRNLSHQLHPPVLEHAGLVVALQSFTEEFSRLEQIQVRLRAEPGPIFPDDIGICVYRVVQEALRNIARHSGASEAEVDLSIVEGDLILTVKDTGRGFDPKRPRGNGLGLASMEERVRLCQGSVQIASEPDRGTTVAVRIPLRSGATLP